MEMATNYPILDFYQQYITYIQGKLSFEHSAVYDYVVKVVLTINST